jgi:hypothetical protein
MMLALTLVGGYLISGAAGFASESPLPARTKPLAVTEQSATSTRQVLPSSASERLVITNTTEILLDGRPCGYQQLPGNAIITFAEVGSDRQTVLRIHFRGPD